MTLRRLISATMTLVLLVTSGTMAVARGEMAGHAMLHMLCIDGEVRVVALGADGAPVENHGACPDCVIGALLSLDGDAAFSDFSTVAGAAEPALPPALLLQRKGTRTALARAPPVSV